jgi:hypothetical protein
MTLPRDLEELQRRDTTITCPHCGDRVKLTYFSDFLKHPGGGKISFVAYCPNIERERCDPIFCVYEDLNNEIIRVYPSPGVDANRMHEAIPENMRQDFAEARRCLHCQAFKGCVVMCRRVVDALACDKLGSDAKRDDGQTKRLTKLIEMLLERGLITKAIKDTADEIRFFGDYGAHTQDDGLDAVSMDDAKTVLTLTYELIKAIYVTPFEAQKLRKKREEP